MKTTRKSVLVHQGTIDAAGSTLVELIQPPNRIDWDWADEVSFILDVQSVQGSPAAWSLGAKFQFCMPDTTGAGYTAERWFDLQPEQIAKCIVEGVDWYGGVPGVTTYKNLVTNPSVETGSTGWGNNAGTGGVATVTRPTDGGYSRATYRRMTWTTASTDASGSHSTDISPTSVVPGTTYSGGMWVRSSKTQRIRGAIQWKDATTFLTKTSGTAFVVQPNVWTFVPVTGTAPAGSDRGGLIAEVVTGTSSAAWAVGDTWDADAAIFGVGSSPHTFFDGASPNSAWDGTADASTSTQTLGRAVTPNLIANEADTLPLTVQRTIKHFGSRVRVVLTPTFLGGTAPTLTVSLLAVAKG